MAFADEAHQAVSNDGDGLAPSAESNLRVAAPNLGSDSVSESDILASGASLEVPPAAEGSGMESVAVANHGGLDAPMRVLGYDTRIRTYTTNYPQRAIVYIEYNGRQHCTGWMTSDDTLATAGHCVHTGGSSGDWYDYRLFRVYPGRNDSSAPYGSCTVRRLYSVVGWTQRNKRTHDYGSMKLNCTVGNTVGWFGFYYPSTSGCAQKNQPLIISGYPGDKGPQQWTSSDKNRKCHKRLHRYRADTIGGQSGSPLWHDKDEALAQDGAWAIGIHTYGSTTENGGTRIQDKVFNNLVSWKDAP